ncbi:MAG: hypothetical protein QM756_12320 [Polyangiaceae bacterium]
MASSLTDGELPNGWELVVELPLPLRRGAYAILEVINNAAGAAGAREQKRARTLLEGLIGRLPKERSVAERRVQVKDVLERAAGAWLIPPRRRYLPTHTVAQRLARIAPEFSQLTEAQLIRFARERGLNKLAARCSCAVHAFGDRNIETAAAAYKVAAAYAKRRPRKSRAKGVT